MASSERVRSWSHAPLSFLTGAASALLLVALVQKRRRLARELAPENGTSEGSHLTSNAPRAPNSRQRAPRHTVSGLRPHIVTENADDYRAAIFKCVREGDVVLEVGCHQGMTLSMIARAVGKQGKFLYHPLCCLPVAFYGCLQASRSALIPPNLFFNEPRSFE